MNTKRGCFEKLLYFLSPDTVEVGSSLVHQGGNFDTSNDELQVVASVSE